MRTGTIKRAALAVIAGLALAACDQTDPNGPAPAVEKLFEPYLKGGNTAAAALVGKRIAEKAKAAGVEKVAFDRSGFAYHGRVKALAEAAREAGLQF